MSSLLGRIWISVTANASVNGWDVLRCLGLQSELLEKINDGVSRLGDPVVSPYADVGNRLFIIVTDPNRSETLVRLPSDVEDISRIELRLPGPNFM